MGTKAHPDGEVLNTPLTMQQRKFADAYIESPQGGKAALIAGYAESSAAVTATRLLKNPKVINYINNKLEKPKFNFKLKPNKIVQEFENIALDKNNSTKDRLKALDLLAKIHRLYEPDFIQNNIQVNNINTDSLRLLTDEQLLKMKDSIQ